MNRLNFNHLYYFYVVAKEGSIKAAADKLHLSQPTISDQLKLLEDFLDCRLFDRKNRGLYLNKEGQLALKYAEKIFDLGHEVTYRLRNKVELPKRTLDIGITHFMSHYFLYDTILPLFDRDGVTTRIRENERHLLMAELEEGNLDMVFTDNKDSLSGTMDAYRLGVNRTFAVAHKKFKKHIKSFPQGLNSIPFFNYTNDSFLKFEIEIFFLKNGLSPRVIGEGDDIDLFQLVTEKSLAFTIVPGPAKNRICKNKDIVVLGELEELQTTVWGIIKKSYKGLGYQLLSKKLQ